MARLLTFYRRGVQNLVMCVKKPHLRRTAHDRKQVEDINLLRQFSSDAVFISSTAGANFDDTASNFDIVASLLWIASRVLSSRTFATVDA